ncbi:hypothetical protein CARUB_v10020952mg [Capsella rubella]|uniref:Senescence regulator S40 n=1 Tax=Capsella rubella TaxID=81985 RepID=R0I0K6_9BRAS|nr:uncharacterized protein LOC17895950 [Capsella rubella]EOA35719.1 hypothetical protein CARUB_v10020952mg [Capsella rubella]
MAKGLKPTTTTMNRSDRYLGSYGYGGSHGTSVTDELELAEEDIWSPPVIHDTSAETDESYRAWNLRATLGKNGRVGGLSLAFEGSLVAPPQQSSPIILQQINDGGDENRRKLASSAPVNVPDWSKIYRVNSVESVHEMNGDDDEEDDEESRMMMPPHEYVAKSQARRSRKIGGVDGGASVFEGVGRTLKGRELRRVRDAIWSQTGFYG